MTFGYDGRSPGTRRYIKEIEHQGGETHILVGDRASKLEPSYLRSIDRERVRDHDMGTRTRLTLLAVTGYRFYSRKHGSRQANLAYLCGHDGGGRWAVRVPGTTRTVQDALRWLTPARVHDARHANKQVLRQGSIFVVETSAQYDMRPLLLRLGAHNVEQAGTGYLLTHSEHNVLPLQFPCRFVWQKSLTTNRGTAND